MSDRNRTIDICKCFAMTFIILIHVLQRTTLGFNQSFVGSFFVVLGVPIYFFLSGISLSYRKPLKPVGFFFDIIRRGINYMWPVVFFLILRVALYNQWANVPKAFEEFWEYPVMGLWFLWVLLWINLASDIGLFIASIFPKYKKVCVFFVVLISYALIIILRQQNIIHSNTFIGYDYFIAYVPIFLFGYLFGDKLFKFINKWVSLASLIIGLTVTILIIYYSRGLVVVDLPTNIPLFYIASIFAFLSIYGLATLIEQYKFSKVIAFAGRFTLEAYFLHLMLIKNWSNMGLTDNGLATGYTIGLFLLCVVNTVGVVAVTCFIPFGHLLMFGKSYSFYKFEKDFFNKIKQIVYSH